MHIHVFADEGDEYMAMCAPRYKPEELEKISNKTKFSKSELQVMYRGFKQVDIKPNVHLQRFPIYKHKTMIDELSKLNVSVQSDF